MMKILDYVIMKTERAKEHLDELNGKLEIFLKGAYTVVDHEDVEKGLYTRRTHFKGMDPVIGMLLGEFLYCLRSVLRVSP